MLIVDRTIYEVESKQKNILMENVYDILIGEDTVTQGENKKEILRIISWLPNIAKIEITMTFVNNWLDITFTNGETMRFYNTGIEYALSCLVR